MIYRARAPRMVSRPAEGGCFCLATVSVFSLCLNLLVIYSHLHVRTCTCTCIHVLYVLLCFVICLTVLASFVFPSLSLNNMLYDVHSSCSAQNGQHEPCKGECCSCLGTATNLLDIYVINVRSYTNRLQTILCSTVA